MNIKDFMAGKKITEVDIAQLRKNREGNPYLNSMEQMISEDGRIMNYILSGKMPSSKRDSEEEAHHV
ncbi:MAG: hypothetical protein IJI10_07620 [Eubacterium sp.]|nr:hypothetical protein [Eubacterium sp.]